MSHRFLRRLALFAAALPAACANSPPEGNGQVAVALVSTGAGGVVYRLPAGTQLQIGNASSFFDRIALDGDTTSVVVDLPPDQYQISLVDAALNVPAQWTLERVLADNTSATVPATLSMPSTISVVADQATDLVLRFTVATGEVIEFTQGHVDVTLEVDQATATSYDLSFSQAVSVSNLGVTADSPAELGTVYPALGSELQLEGSLHIAGPWTLQSTEDACAPATIDSLDTPVSAGPLFPDHLAEARSAPDAHLCIHRFAGGANAVNIFFGRTGAATTPTFTALGDRQIFFGVAISFLVDVTSFDGHTLDLQALSSAHAGAGNLFLDATGSAVGSQDVVFPWYGAFLEGTTPSFSFIPR